jgi:hypothetical protein
VCNTCEIISEFFNLFIDTPLQQNSFCTVLKSLSWNAAPDTSSDHKNWVTDRCTSTVQTESGAAMINGMTAMTELT